jgi:hypothetical protein
MFQSLEYVPAKVLYLLQILSKSDKEEHQQIDGLLLFGPDDQLLLF